MDQKKITVIGGGLAGSLLSIYLAKRGFNVEIFERRPDMRKENISAGRSINLALSTRGIHALDEVGLKEKIMAIAIPMKGRMLHSQTGELSFLPYGKDDSEVINSVSRGNLNKHLMDAGEKPYRVKINFNCKCTGIDFKTGELKFYNQVTNTESTFQSHHVIGADGSASAIRTDMLRVGRFSFSQDYLEHGYKELTIPPGPNGEFLLEKNALHIWPRGTYMLIALPNLDGSFTCTLFFPHEGKKSFESLRTEEKVVDFFNRQFPDAVPHMPTLLEDFFTNPTGNLVTIKCRPWHVEDKACLLGDAAHAIVPFFGQGMNCAFEDCTILNECIARYRNDWLKTFQNFERRRKVDTDAIAELALANYFEMRGHVANPKFLLKKEVEFALEEKYPHLFIPKYSMVSFHRIPYSVAQSKGKIQDEILERLCQSINSVEELDWALAGKLLKERLG